MSDRSNKRTTQGPGTRLNTPGIPGRELREARAKSGGKAGMVQVRREIKTSESETREEKRRGITSEDQIYLVVGGKVVSWEEVTKMEEGAMVEVAGAMRGGGREKRKERNLWNSSEESSTRGMSTQDEGDEGEAEDLWMEVVRK